MALDVLKRAPVEELPAADGAGAGVKERPRRGLVVVSLRTLREISGKWRRRACISSSSLAPSEVASLVAETDATKVLLFEVVRTDMLAVPA